MFVQLVCKGVRGERKRSRRDTVKIPFKLTLYFTDLSHLNIVLSSLSVTGWDAGLDSASVSVGTPAVAAGCGGSGLLGCAAVDRFHCNPRSAIGAGPNKKSMVGDSV
jgi:hypothetical protein